MDSSKTPSGGAEHTPSMSELMASAKIVADATRAKMSNQEYDQNKAAAAAAIVLSGASHCGKLDESTGLGKILDKAEDYLHNFSSTAKTGDGHGDPVTTHETTTQTAGNVKEVEGHGSSGGCPYAEYVKMAQGLLGDNKAHGGSGEADGGGYGDYMKMAGDLLKK